MIAARQELELRPALEQLDRVIAASEGIDPDTLTFAFRPLWQLDAASAATIALQKAQATQVYAGLNLWPKATMARLVAAQLAEDGTYPNASAVFGEGGAADPVVAGPTLDYDPGQPRDPDGRWTAGGSKGSAAPGIATVALRAGGGPEVGSASSSIGNSPPHPSGQVLAQEVDPDEESRRPGETGEPGPGDVILIQRFNAALQSLSTIDPNNQNLTRLEPPGTVPTEEAVERIEAATRQAYIDRTCDFVRPNGRFIGQEGTSSRIRLMPGGGPAAQQDYDYLSQGGTPLTIPGGLGVRLPYDAGTVVLRWSSTSTGEPAIDVRNQVLGYRRLHY